MSEKYEKLPVTCDAAICSVEAAIAQLGYSPPTLHVHPAQANDGLYVARQLSIGIDIQADIDLDVYEWYVEWNGKRIGSKGL